MAQKDDLLDEARGLGIDPEELAAALEKPEASIADLKDAIDKATDPAVPLSVFLAGAPAGTNVPLSGVLAEKPEIADAELKASEWQALVDEYLQTPRP